MTTTYRAELTAAVATLSAELETLRLESIRLNAAVLASAAGSAECVILCAHAEGVRIAHQRTFEQWNATCAELRDEQDL
jgi:hypothetical protein